MHEISYRFGTVYGWIRLSRLLPRSHPAEVLREKLVQTKKRHKSYLTLVSPAAKNASINMSYRAYTVILNYNAPSVLYRFIYA